jgi:hypothetical protein
MLGGSTGGSNRLDSSSIGLTVINQPLDEKAPFRIAAQRTKGEKSLLCQVLDPGILFLQLQTDPRFPYVCHPYMTFHP